MEKMEGVDLAVLVQQAEEEIIIEKKKNIGSMIRGIWRDIEKFREERRHAEIQVQKLSDKIQKAEAKLREVRNGNWNILQENQGDSIPSRAES